jgi:hypothetical protein
MQQRIFAQTKPRSRPRPGDDIEPLTLSGITEGAASVLAADATLASIDAVLDA